MSATYPMDLVRGRLTVQVLWAILKMRVIEEFRCFLTYFLSIITVIPYLQTESSANQYRGMVHALSTVLREEGFRALYKGWLPSVIGVVSPGKKFRI